MAHKYRLRAAQLFRHAENLLAFGHIAVASRIVAVQPRSVVVCRGGFAVIPRLVPGGLEFGNADVIEYDGGHNAVCASVLAVFRVRKSVDCIAVPAHLSGGGHGSVLPFRLVVNAVEQTHRIAERTALFAHVYERVARAVGAFSVAAYKAILILRHTLDEQFLAALPHRVVRGRARAVPLSVAVVVSECEYPRDLQTLENLGVPDKIRHLGHKRHIHHRQVAVDDDEVGGGRRHEVLYEPIRLVVAGASHHFVFFVIVHLRVGEHHYVQVPAVGDIQGGVAVFRFGRFDKRDRRALRLVARGERRGKRHAHHKHEKQCGQFPEFFHNSPLRRRICTYDK